MIRILFVKLLLVGTLVSCATVQNKTLDYAAIQTDYKLFAKTFIQLANAKQYKTMLPMVMPELREQFKEVMHDLDWPYALPDAKVIYHVYMDEMPLPKIEFQVEGSKLEFSVEQKDNKWWLSK